MPRTNENIFSNSPKNKLCYICKDDFGRKVHFDLDQQVK